MSSKFENAKQVIADVTANVSQRSASRKDEITVMKAMMNDSDFSVDVYEKDGKVGEYYPAREIRKMVANVMASTTRIPNKEAAELVDSYEFTKSDAAALVGASKEFVNTYLHTGRKLPLGGRETSNIELMWKEVAKRTAGIPSKDGSRAETIIPAHGGIKASCPCPKWVK